MKRGGVSDGDRQGFTIVETLIVLAVTSFLLIIAMVFISGKQAKTEFAVSIRQVQQRFTQVITETASGYYPNNGSFQCVVGPMRPLRLQSMATAQGTNSDCTFVGKTIVTGVPVRSDNLAVYSLAGRRESGGEDIKLLSDAYVTALAPTVGPPNTSMSDMTATYKLPGGLRFVGGRIQRLDNTYTSWNTATPFAISIMSSLANFATISGGNSTGTQNFSLYAFTNAAWPNNTSLEADNINAELNWNNRIQRAEYCFASGGTNQAGLVTVGSGAGGMNVKLTIKTGTSCA